MTTPIQIAHPRCEFTKNPLGIDSLKPSLSWQIHAPGQNHWTQHAYQIQVATSETALRAERPDHWDSGPIESSRSNQIPCDGPPLRSATRYFWRVRVWGKDKQPSEWSDIQHWETGLLEPNDWAARWIGYTGGWNGQALYFRSRFSLDRPVRQARAYIAGLGYYELRLNGEKTGDHVLDPGWTDYAKRVLYVTYDITAQLRHGVNVVGVIVGNGWYGMPKLLLVNGG